MHHLLISQGFKQNPDNQVFSQNTTTNKKGPREFP